MILNAFKLAGRTAIVTGARTGLGQGMAFGLTEAGADIVGIDLSNLVETQRGVEERSGKFLGIEANLSNIKVIDGIINQTIHEFKKIDILIIESNINNATDDHNEKPINTN